MERRENYSMLTGSADLVGSRVLLSNAASEKFTRGSQRIQSTLAVRSRRTSAQACLPRSSLIPGPLVPFCQLSDFRFSLRAVGYNEPEAVFQLWFIMSGNFS